MSASVVESRSKVQVPVETEKLCCAHCGSPLKNSTQQFCCSGCSFVYRTLHSMGLSNYYDLQSLKDSLPAENVNPEKDYSYLEQPELQEKFTRTLASGFLQVQFYLPSMHCAACVWLLEKLPQSVASIQSTRVSFGSGQIELVIDPKQITLRQLASLLNSIGYPPVPATQAATAASNRLEDRQMLRRIGVAAVSAANSMMLAESLFQSFSSGMEESYQLLFKGVSALIVLPAVVYSAIPFYRSAIGSLILGRFHIDLPISLAIIAAYVAGIVSTVNGGKYVYFDSVADLIFLLLIARYVQKRAIHRARSSTMTSWDLFPATVRCISAERVTEKPARELAIGDVVEVRANERIPADGEVIAGSSSVDSSFLTGESLPVAVCQGSRVLAGSINIESSIQLRVEQLGAGTRLGKIISALEHSESRRTKIEDQANRLAAYFVGAVLVLALLTYVGWSLVDASRAFDCTVALLIVTCPCALGLAIPVAISVSLAQAQKQRIYIKSTQALQTLSEAEHFYFDKTGTLTAGSLTVVDAIADRQDLEIAGALAQVGIVHPVGKAISRYCSQIGRTELCSVRLVPGKGVEARMLNGDSVSMGSLKWYAQREIAIPAHVRHKIDDFLQAELSLTLLEVNQTIKAVFALQDSVLPTARTIVSQLQQQKKKVFILSGDSQNIVTQVAARLGIPAEQAIGELEPQQKAEIIAADQKICVMIGDGVNDALALQVADVGIGLRGGVEATLESADIFAADGGIESFWHAYRGARKTRAVISRNLIFSVIYNIAGAAAACFGVVNPFVAAILMPLSSLTVVLSSVAANYFKTRN